MSIMPAALIDMCRMTSCDVSSAKALLSDVDVNARFITTPPIRKLLTRPPYSQKLPKPGTSIWSSFYYRMVLIRI